MSTKPKIDIQPSQVVSVYSGKDGKCCCGCAGKHYANTPANLRMVTKILDILRTSPAEQVEDLGSCLSVVVGARVYIAYLA